MIYLLYLFVLVFAWLYCFKAVRFQAEFFFVLFRGVGLATDRDHEGFLRVYSTAAKGAGLLFGIVAVVFAVTEFLG
jgi:hypothetical protein